MSTIHPHAGAGEGRTPDADPSRTPSGERRLAAIAALDVAGYSKLTERDETGTHARWMRIRSDLIIPSIQAHGGTAVSDTGDGFLIEFRSAWAAVSWASDLQRSLGEDDAGASADPIRIRIAVHVGEIIVERTNIFGEDVNITARLQEFAEPGGIVLSGSALDQIRAPQRPEVEPIGPLRLKNIERVVTAFRIAASGRASEPPAGSATATHRPSIAVLPFRIATEAGVERYFAEGIAHEIVGSLCALKELFVVASSSTLRFAGHQDPAEIGRRLGVRYLLTGSMSRARDRLRLMAELSDVETQARLWWTRDDVSEDELFGAQDVIAGRVAHHLLPHLRQTELQRALRKSPDNRDAYDLFLQALHRLYRFMEGDFASARQLLEEAVARDPDYAPAHAMLAKWHILNFGQGYSREREASAEAAIACAARAVELNPADPVALAMYGHTLAFLQGALDQAVHVFDKATAAGPNCAIAWAFSSPTYAYLGDGPGAVARAEYALRLSPLDPYAFFYEGILGLAHYFNADYDRAARICLQVASSNSRFSANLRPLMASLVALGRMEEARSAASLHRDLEPEFRLSRFRARYPIRDEEQLATYCDRLAAAGVPD